MSGDSSSILNIDIYNYFAASYLEIQDNFTKHPYNNKNTGFTEGIEMK